MHQIALYIPLLIIVASTGLLGMMAGALGAFAFLRNQGMLGDAIAHASLPGTVIMFLVTCTKNSSLLCCGGILTALLGILLVELISAYTILKRDVAIGIILSVFFGCGLILLTSAQKYSLEGQALLNRVLFGNAATITMNDLLVIACVSGMLLVVLLVWWKEFLLVLFDPQYAHTSGYRVALINIVLMVSIVAIVSLGLQTTGGVLMSTLLLAPAAAAYQWTTTFSYFVMLSSLFGALSAMSGALLSSLIDQLPTGPAIVVMAGSIVIISLVCGRRTLYV
jgi:manganese/zinc/iron transport system permease protein